MNNPRNTSIITKAALGLVVAAAFVFAHGGFDHITGLLLSVKGSVLTVKTSKGNEDVKIDAKTEITKGDQKALAADLLPGLRVIVDVPEGSKDKPPVAHSVKIGVAAPAAKTTK
jgi:hypothetical protein